VTLTSSPIVFPGRVRIQTLPLMHTRLFVLSIVTVLTPYAFAQSASLAVFRGSALACPVSSTSLNLFLENTSSSVQTIPAGTTMTLNYSVPVVRAPAVPGGATSSFSGNTVSVVFSQDNPIPVRTSLAFNTQLNLQGLADGTPVSVSVSLAPSSAVTFTGQGSATVLAIVDLPSCTSPVLPAVTVDDLNASCPSAEEIAAFNADLNITFEGDPTAGKLVCRAADGSADLTLLKERTYQALRIMRQLSFDTPLPWTTKSLYDWLTGTIKGIRSRTDITNSFCCDPANTINIASSHLGPVDFITSEWIGSQGVLYDHESRHNQGLLHTCGSNDQTLNELGAWGVQYYVQEWMTRHSDPFFTPRIQTPASFRGWFWSGAQSMINNTICDLGSGVVAVPKSLDFGAQPVGVASLTRIVALTLTKGVGTSVAAVAVTGANSGDFKVTADTCTGATIAPSCVVSLSFTPSAAAVRNAALVFNYGAGLSQNVPLTGTGGGSTCSYSLTTSGRLQPAGGGSGTVTIATAPGCVWTASSKSSWLGVNPPNGSGTGMAIFTVGPNQRDGARQGVLAMGGQTVSIAQAGTPIPQFQAASITNAASFAVGATPGGLATIFGSGLTRNVSGVVGADRLPLPTQLAGTSVEFVGFDSTGTIKHLDAPLLAVANVGGQEQINLQIPYEIIAANPVEIVIRNNGLLSGLLNYQLRSAHPGIFTVDGTAGAILHEADNSLVTTSSPAARNEVVLLYATGLGAVSPVPGTGQPAPGVEPLSRTVATPIVTIGGVGAQVPFSGLAPGFVGLYQVNVRIPPNAPLGAVQVLIQAGGVFSKAATIAIQ
jgi:uncharacterized protein (TIGR03437 family)